MPGSVNYLAIFIPAHFGILSIYFYYYSEPSLLPLIGTVKVTSVVVATAVLSFTFNSTDNFKMSSSFKTFCCKPHFKL